MDNYKIKLVSVEEGITALGFRRIASLAREIYPKAEIYFFPVGDLYSLKTHLFPSAKRNIKKEDIQTTAKELARANLLCFSSMTPPSPYVIKIVKAVKRINPKIFILWGGAHCIINPGEAIKYVDGICTGEGEVSFGIFFKSFLKGKNYLKTPGMWFNTNKGIIKNRSPKLISSKEMDSFPHLFYGLTCQIYDRNKRTFRNFTAKDYVQYNGLSYRTIWTIGCPFSCIYCANDAFIKNDPNYRKIRYPSINYMLEEIEKNIKMYPFVTTVVFYDDNFIAIPLNDIKIFAKEYKKRINLPFVVFGIHPNLVTKEKIDLLGKAGMNRMRMGIQSGSAKILSFYRRPTTLSMIKKSNKILATAAKKYKMIPPAYDIISDNPLETKDDVKQTLKFLYELNKPYTLTIFSLRVFPNTRLYDYFIKYPSIDIRSLSSSYLETRKTFSNILLYTLAIIKPPQLIFFFLLKYASGYQDKQREFPILYFIIKFLYLSSRGFDHLKKLDFTTIAGPWGYYLWKFGIIKS